MNTQLHIDFDLVHRFENNEESQAQLDKYRDVFSHECWNVLKRMLKGEVITMKSGINSGISDIRRRAKDLIDHYGIPVQRDYLVDEDGEKLRIKGYYIRQSDIPGVMMKIVDGLCFSKK